VRALVTFSSTDDAWVLSIGPHGEGLPPTNEHLFQDLVQRAQRVRADANRTAERRGQRRR
jgi:hypothetical protein